MKLEGVTVPGGDSDSTLSTATGHTLAAARRDSARDTLKAFNSPELGFKAVTVAAVTVTATPRKTGGILLQCACRPGPGPGRAGEARARRDSDDRLG